MKVLVTEDSAVYRHLLVTQLGEWGLDVATAVDAESALPCISGAGESLLLLVDWELPGMSGVELISEVRQLKLKHYVYVIILTARSDKGDLVRALNAGADDYLVKPFHVEELQARIQVAQRTLVLHEALVAANKQLECLAYQDPLTELLNRRALMLAIHRERKRALRKKSSITLVMCDIDKFKQVNDGFGHGVGDDVLKLVAKELRRACRDSDVVARMGGDEFLLVLLEMESRDAVALVKRAQKGLQERSELLNIPISLSFGIAAMEIEQSEEVALAAADAALYAAKREGRDRCCIAQSDQE
ncbi:MAG: diguanylate cyclase [Candidatus Korobacteraceae bacterium]|jgi:diguanylate cyclase (GGDEF)-like protein